MTPRLHTAILAGKITSRLSKALKKGGGTAAPGLVAERIDPGIIHKLTRHLPQGSIIISGTNGKTTTSRLLSHILKSAHLKPIHNRSGSNLNRGLASVLLTEANLAGKIGADIGLFEVDEAALPSAALQIKPRVLILLNLFRDQLDRHFEVDQVLLRWRQVLSNLPATTTICLNADDPRLVKLGSYAAGPVIYFGINDQAAKLDEMPKSADSLGCPDCNSQLVYEDIYLGHQGKYFCSNCQLKRPELHLAAGKIKLQSMRGVGFELATPKGRLAVNLGVPGFYNVYNALAAAAGAVALGFSLTQIQSGLEEFKAVFGRIERIRVGDKEILLTLVKNPTGFNEVLRMLGGTQHEHLLLALNDLLADGTDVSWIWDVDLEKLADQKTPLTVSGLRAWDLAVRLKYAGINTNLLRVESDLATALREALDNTPSGQTLYILPTYTAMLKIREVLTEMGYVGEFWKE